MAAADAAEIAGLILASFRAYRNRFRDITLAAQARFEHSRWLEGQLASAERIEVYKDYTVALTDVIHSRLNGEPLTASMWRTIKREYAALIATQPDFELCETYFNSIHRDITPDHRIDETQSFVWSEFDEPPVTPAEPIYRTYAMSRDTVLTVARILARSRVHVAVAEPRTRRAQHPAVDCGSKARNPPYGRTRRRNSEIGVLSQ